MQDIGSFLPDNLRESTDQSIQKIGQKVDLFDSFETGFEWVMGYTHGLFDTSSYLANIIQMFNKTDETYNIDEQV